MPSLKLSNPFRRGADRPTLKERAAALRATAGRVMRRPAPTPAGEAAPVDWHNPPSGLMAHPAIEPQCFLNIKEGIRHEADRLLGIAIKEFERRADALGSNATDAERSEWVRKLRGDFHLDALASIAHPDMIESVVGVRYKPETAEELGADLPAADIPAATNGDPIHAAIAASRAAQAAYETWERSTRGRMTKAAFAKEDQLVGEQWRTRDAAFATVPTTRAGQLALIEYASWQLRLHGHLDGSPPDADCGIWQETHQALSASLEAGVVAEAGADFLGASDLSSLSVHELMFLAETYRNASMWWARIEAAPWAWSSQRREYRSPAGNLAEAEYERHGRQWELIHAESLRREPASVRERDELLQMRLAYEMASEGRIRNRSLLADLTKAWGA